MQHEARTFLWTRWYKALLGALTDQIQTSRPDCGKLTYDVGGSLSLSELHQTRKEAVSPPSLQHHAATVQRSVRSTVAMFLSPQCIRSDSRQDVRNFSEHRVYKGV